jgi:hypothetical protein
MALIQQLKNATTPPAEIVFGEAVRSKLKTLSFQDPEKVSDGLSYIWSENQKWQKISASYGGDEKTIKIQLKLIIARRNAIVHEADIDAVSNSKIPITRVEANEVSTFLRKLGETIHALVL